MADDEAPLTDNAVRALRARQAEDERAAERLRERAGAKRVDPVRHENDGKVQRTRSFGAMSVVGQWFDGVLLHVVVEVEMWAKDNVGFVETMTACGLDVGACFDDLIRVGEPVSCLTCLQFNFETTTETPL